MRKYRLQQYSHPGGQQWILENDDAGLGILDRFLEEDGIISSICERWNYEIKPDLLSRKHQWFEYDYKEFRFTNSGAIEICEVLPDRTGTPVCTKFPAQHVLDFIPIYGTATHKIKDPQEIELTYDGQKIRLYLDGKEFTEQDDSNIDNYCAIVNSTPNRAT